MAKNFPTKKEIDKIIKEQLLANYHKYEIAKLEQYIKFHKEKLKQLIKKDGV